MSISEYLGKLDASKHPSPDPPSFPALKQQALACVRAIKRPQKGFHIC